jgi:hypothetical protein
MTRDKNQSEEAWEQRCYRTIKAAIRTGRPVRSDSEGVLCYTNGERVQIFHDSAELPIPDLSQPPTRWTRAWHWILSLWKFK